MVSVREHVCALVKLYKFNLTNSSAHSIFRSPAHPVGVAAPLPLVLPAPHSKPVQPPVRVACVTTGDQSAKPRACPYLTADLGESCERPAAAAPMSLDDYVSE